MNLMLKEIIFEIATETCIEWFCCFFPMDCVGKGEFLARFDRDGILRG